MKSIGEDLRSHGNLIDRKYFFNFFCKLLQTTVKCCHPMRIQNPMRHLKYIFLMYKRNNRSLFRTLSSTSKMERFFEI